MADEATQELTVTPDAVAGGTTSVSDEVVEKIAVAAARSVPGVTELGGDVARFFNSVLDRVGLDKVGDATRGASAAVTNGAAVINLVTTSRFSGAAAHPFAALDGARSHGPTGDAAKGRTGIRHRPFS
ncbi:hypothetical protein [Micromonospora globbae]|uniref:hypothetical protein n=1 Tax=Micromonospora globbae TaxID=1894969 RepID=UPI00343FFF8E